MVNPNALIIRRATVDDLPTLKSIWISMQMDAEALEPHLTDFQVVERDGEVVGAIGFQILRTAGCLYGEGYSDFSVADTARELFWDRLQKLAASHGVFRLWTQEKSPFWQHWGFSTADEESLARLPGEWKASEEKWFTLELKNEAVITAALNKQFASYSASEKKSADEIASRAKTITLALTILLLMAFFGCIGFGIWWFMNHRPPP